MNRLLTYLSNFGCFVAASVLLLLFAVPAKAVTIDTAQLNKMLKKANASFGKPDTAKAIGLQVFRQAKQIKNLDIQGKASVILCTAELYLNNMPAAVRWNDTARFYLQKTHNYLWMGYGDLNIGTISNKSYAFEKSIGYLTRALNNFEKAKDTLMQVSCYSELGAAFHDFENYKVGKAYSVKAVNLAKTKPGHKNTLWRAMCVLAINYDDNKEYDEALRIHFANLPNATTPLFQCANYNNIGNSSKKKGDYAQASKYFELALQKARLLKDDYQYATIYTNLAEVSLLKGDRKTASAYIVSGVKYSKRSRSPEKLIDAYEVAGKVAAQQGDYKKAMHYQADRAAIKDSLLNADKARIIYDLQVQYETEKKEKDNQRLQFERKKAENDKQLTIYAAVLSVVAIAVIFILVYRNSLTKARYREQQKLTTAIFEGEQNERIRIARDLHDSIGQMLAVIKMNLHATTGQEQTVSLVNQAIEEVRYISHNLIPETLNFGLFAALEDLCEKVSAGGTATVSMNLPDQARQHQFEKANELSIYRIVQEVLSNMVKHAQATHIQLNVVLRDNNMILAIKDNGKGFDTAGINQSKGIGWKNIAARVNLLNGNMQVQSEQLSGTQIEISIPQK